MSPQNFLKTAACIGASLFFAFGVQAQQPSIVDGVYTDEQAESAKALYSSRCAMCHGDNLGGSAMAPPLMGFPFTSFYTGKTLGDVLAVFQTMPADNPGSLSMKQYVELMAYVLKTNGYPAGETPLPEDPEVLAGISFVAPAN